jgi:hypothetical protein
MDACHERRVMNGEWANTHQTDGTHPSMHPPSVSDLSQPPSLIVVVCTLPGYAREVWFFPSISG